MYLHARETKQRLINNAVRWQAVITEVRVTNTSKWPVPDNASIVHYSICNIKQMKLITQSALWWLRNFNYIVWSNAFSCTTYKIVSIQDFKVHDPYTLGSHELGHVGHVIAGLTMVCYSRHWIYIILYSCITTCRNTGKYIPLKMD